MLMTKIFAPAVLSILLAGMSASGGEKERPLKVFVLAGTSNMLGAPPRSTSCPTICVSH